MFSAVFSRQFICLSVFLQLIDFNDQLDLLNQSVLPGSKPLIRLSVFNLREAREALVDLKSAVHFGKISIKR
jgi:hypothetical protein